MKWLQNTVLLAASLYAVPALSGDVTPDLYDAVQSTKPGGAVRVIIRLGDQARPQRSPGESLIAFRKRLVKELRAKANATQAGLKTFLLANKATGLRQLWAVNALAARVPVALVSEIAQRSEVDLVQLNRTLKRRSPPPASSFGPEQWNLAMVGVEALWSQGISGQGAQVANMDTGIDLNHNALRDKWRGMNQGSQSASWFDPYGQSTVPYDLSGHGTQTMGLMAGGSSTAPMGVAPGVQWIAAKIFDDGGNAELAKISEAFAWLLNPDGDPNTTSDVPDVVNASWGISGIGVCDTTFATEIENLRLAGILPVFAAGNDGQGPGVPSSSSPADDPNAFAVGALDEASVVDFSSSRGPSACTGDLFPQVVAPGVNVLSADLTLGAFPDATAGVSGTSFAAPHVAAAAALLKSAVPSATPEYLQAALERTAKDIGTPGADFDSGYGVINVYRAYQWLLVYNGLPLGEDMDGDSYTRDVDCNDSDPTIHPRAKEVKHDRIDQDCNGFDLTIDVIKSVYREKLGERLVVEATSDLGQSAALRVVGFGKMNWNANRKVWRLVVNDSGDPPANVRVRGIEGWTSARVRTPGLN